MVAYLFVVDMYYLNWHILLGGSVGLCAIEFDVISNFICFGCCKVGIWNISSSITWAFHVTNCSQWTNINFFVSCFFCSTFYRTKLATNVHEKIHPFSFFIHIFIHKYHSFMTHGRILFHVTKYFVLSVIEYFLNILSTWEEYSEKDLVMFPCSCSPTHVHVNRFMK
jgi:hypothetical protein